MRLLLLALAAGCTSAASAAPDPCSAAALGINNTRLLETWTPPANCTIEHPPARTIIHSQGDLASLFHCTGTATPPKLDFTHNSLLIITWDMSPGSTGIDALDDSTTVTFVMKERAPCPKDPQPMPMQRTDWFVIASANASRNYGDRTCTRPSTCQ